MRYDVKKFLFIGVESDREAFFKKAQEEGIINFINSQSGKPKETSPKVDMMAKAITILRGQPVIEQEETSDYSIAYDLAKSIVNLKSSLGQLEEEQRVTRLEMARVEMFGDFSKEDLAYVKEYGHRVTQFYCAKLGFADKTEQLPENVIYIASDHGLDYFIAFNKERTQYTGMIEMEVERPWGVLKKRSQELASEINALEHRLKAYAKYNRFFHHALVHELNEFHLNEAKGFVEFPIDKESIFAVQGWVAVPKIEAMHAFIKKMKVHVEEIDIDPDDEIPTYLENEGSARIGEDLVHIYDPPSITDKDPSMWVLFFFALFFSMIIGDGGYGLILLLVALYIRYKHSGLHSYKKRALDLLTILGFSCLVWGLLSTSFFGITITPDSPLRKVSVVSWLVEKKAEYHIEHQDEVYQEWVDKYPELATTKNPTAFLMKASTKDAKGNVNYEAYSKFSDNIMMELALLVGVIHIILSMARHISRNLSYVGWILLIIGAYLYAPSFLNATSIANFVFGISSELAEKNSLYMIYGGFILAVAIAIYHHKWFGLLEASVAIQIFGDVMSYMRLYALGLAGALLTATIMDLAASVPFFFGLLILVFGHTINLVLGIMGGVIHGLRLNFLEWYHYCFEGGGRMFNALRKQEIE